MLQKHRSLHYSHPLPYGAIVLDRGVQFVIFSRSATSVRVLLYDHVDDREPADVLHLDPQHDRWGDIWSLWAPDLGPGALYHLQADGPWDPARGHRFDGRARLIDPYARALAGNFLPCYDGVVRPPKCVVVEDHFDWQGDRHLRRDVAETVIYEMHVRGFTKSPTSEVQFPGTYLGVIEKIPHLKSLGITAVELMPVMEYPINSCLGDANYKPNYWGYDPMAFFAPHRGYAVDPAPGAQVHEFKQMVRALHAAGIEVILDVVFNHTAEGNELGPTLSFKGLENQVYYMLEPGTGQYKNYSGCGNTVNGNHPIVREMIFLCLRHWVLNYHIDGFRFDLASILSRDRNGHLVPNPPLVEAIAEDPLLSDTKIIAEAWDAAGAYQVGSFSNVRWAEWNGRYRDDVRRFWRGDAHLTGALATRMAGSSDLYEPSGRRPYHSINFITSHDGFTLNDLVSYNEKHNEANGENNFDGDNNNYSYNYGAEGPTRVKQIEQIRQRQLKNFLATLLLSHGIPMLVFGDECRRTQRGNNNAYCQDNPLSWFDWKLVEKNEELVRFTRELIAFRRRQPTVRRRTFLKGASTAPGVLPDVSWYHPLGYTMDWSQDESGLTCLLGRVLNEQRNGPGRDVMIMINGGAEPRDYTVPAPALRIPWRLLVDTAAAAPRDIFGPGEGPALAVSNRMRLEGRSIVCFESAD